MQVISNKDGNGKKKENTRLRATKESISRDREGKNEHRNGNGRRRNTIWETETIWDKKKG